MRTDNGWKHRTEVQKIQRKVQVKVSKIHRDPREDKALIVAYLEGNEEAGRELIERYLDIISEIYRYPYHQPIKGRGAKGMGARKPDMNAFDKEDLLQEILLHFFKLVGEYDEERHFEGLVKGKLHHRVFNNFFAEFLEVDSKEEEYDEDFEGNFTDFSHKSSIIIDDDDTPPQLPAQHLELYQAFNQLSKRQRQVMELVVVKEWNSTIVAQELSMSAPTVRVHLKRGLEKLKIIMGAE